MVKFFGGNLARTGILSGDFVIPKAGSCPVGHFTSIPDKSQTFGFFPGQIFWRKFGQNWNPFWRLRHPKSRFVPSRTLHFDSRQKPNFWLFSWSNFLEEIWPELESFLATSSSQKPVRAQ